MAKLLRLIFPAILLAYTACQKPKHINPQSLGEAPAPKIVTVEIQDTLPTAFLSAVHLDKKLPGIQFNYSDRNIVSYFEYKADRTILLDALSKLGFSRNADRADTRCRKLEREEFLFMRDHLSEYERSEASSFWGKDLDAYDAFECLKTPSRHVVLMAKDSDRVFHLIVS